MAKTKFLDARMTFPIWIALPMGGVAILCAMAALWLPVNVELLVLGHAELGDALDAVAAAPFAHLLRWVFAAAAVAALGSVLLALLPLATSRWLIRKACFVVYFAAICWVVFMLRFVGALPDQEIQWVHETVVSAQPQFDAEGREIARNPQAPVTPDDAPWPAASLMLATQVRDMFLPLQPEPAFWWTLRWLAVPLLLTAWVGLVHVSLWRNIAYLHYGRKPYPSQGPDDLAPGDRLLENWRTHGRDPNLRRSNYVSVGLHIFFIILLWPLLDMLGCVTPYRVPKGEPAAAPQPVQIQQVQKKKKLILNPNSPIVYRDPDMDVDSEIDKIVEQMSQATYQVDASRVTKKLGDGEGEGGWPDGMEDALVRFIRLEHNARGWDDGMDQATAADRNFLAFFRRETGFKTAQRGESHPIHFLRKYPEGYAPPFVYMTGSSGFSVSSGDVRVLREYLDNGGMIFADAGSPAWGRSFLSLMRRLKPGVGVRTIADDDPIFRYPFTLPNGPPASAFHTGRQIQGIKSGKRWVVFYSPFDLNDMWKTGRSGIRQRIADQAMQTGVNIVYHAFTHYLEQTAQTRR